MLLQTNEYELVKSITRAEAKGVHKELPPGGVWRTIKGHHVYIKDGKVLAGSIPGVTKAKKATKAQLAEHQTHIDKESKKKAPTKPKATKTTTSKAKGATKGATTTTKATAKTKASTKSTKGAGTNAKSTAKPKGNGKTVPKSTTTTKATKSTPKRTTATKAGDGKNQLPNQKQVKGKGKADVALTVPKTSKTSPTGKGRGSTAKPTSTSKRGTTTTKPSGTKSGAKAPKQAERSEVQKNRKLAYDVGDKIGGARKDDYEKTFRVEPTLAGLEGLERMSPAIAQKMCTKNNILPKFEWEKEKENGVELPTAMLKKMIFDRIGTHPVSNTPEERKNYMSSMQTLHRHLAGIKSFDNMQEAVRELATIANRGKNLARAESALARAESNNNSGGYTNVEYFQQEREKGLEAKKMLDFDPLGDKLNNFFTSFDSRQASMKTVRNNMRTKTWDDYTNPKTTTSKPKENHKIKWERKAESKWLRIGGRDNKLQKPEEMIKDYGVRGVEFGNWVDDSSGKYHLQRCGEAFSDLADVIGVDDKDVSLNNRLAIAFGARGKGGALAHYESSKKVINMTKHGGAGSLAHEWGHAMDNILAQYSRDGGESIDFASDGDMGDKDMKLNSLYAHAMKTIKEGDHKIKVEVDTSDSANRKANYYPRIRDMIRKDHSEAGIKQAIDHHVQVFKNQHERDQLRDKANLERYRLRGDAKGVKRMEQQIKRSETKLANDIKSVPHYIAQDVKSVTGKDYKGTFEVPTGNSELMNRMKAMDGSKPYWSTNREMFARVFEAYVEDKLKKEKRYNNYLVHGTKESDVMNFGAPFPIGNERTKMFQAMDDLMKHVSKQKLLKKALELELLKSLGYSQRNAYNLDFTAFDEPVDEVLYIPLNRLKTPYQTDKATNWDKVQSNADKIASGTPMAPIEIGTDYDIHDGHHRYLASQLRKLTHVPCVVKASNAIERRRAIEAYQEVWKSIQTDPTGSEGAFSEDEGRMFRGIGHKEFLAIANTGYVQSKGKGNDDDKGVETCFSNLRRQAEGYARSNFDLYNEPKAYVISLPKPNWMEEDEHGELIANRPVSLDGILIYEVPKDENKGVN